jgi:hypothetical protein
VNAVVCSKKKKSDKNAEKKQKKDLTGPTLLEISEYDDPGVVQLQPTVQRTALTFDGLSRSRNP